jgi:hypothetical protein
MATGRGYSVRWKRGRERRYPLMDGVGRVIAPRRPAQAAAAQGDRQRADHPAGDARRAEPCGRRPSESVAGGQRRERPLNDRARQPRRRGRANSRHPPPSASQAPRLPAVRRAENSHLELELPWSARLPPVAETPAWDLGSVRRHSLACGTPCAVGTALLRRNGRETAWLGDSQRWTAACTRSAPWLTILEADHGRQQRALCLPCPPAGPAPVPLLTAPQAQPVRRARSRTPEITMG